MFRLLVAGGGTGGHLFPGVAVAEEFLRRDTQAEVLFVGTGRPVEAEILDRLGLAGRKITAAGFKGKGLAGRLRSLTALPVGLVQSAAIISGFKPDMVFGVGGYVSGPVGLASRIMGRSLAIHEQNSVPGMANRLLGRIANLVFISFESARGFFPAGKTYLSGNPIRQEIAASAGQKRREEAGRFVLLVVGGSQGAHAVNTAVVEAMRVLDPREPALKVIHQTGTTDYNLVKAAYREMGIEAEVRPFIRDMGRVYSAADLIIGRAGALTVAEIAAMRRPAIFIPLPSAANNHQEINARSLTEVGAAEIILQKDLTPDLLAERLRRLVQDKTVLKKMAEAASQTARPDAASAICDICLEYLAGKTRRGS